MFTVDTSKKLEALQAAVGAEGEIKPRRVEPDKINKSGMHFIIRAYEIPGVGYASEIDMRAFLGLMRMSSIIVTPLCVDMPLMSYDYINAMGKSTLICECYDTTIAHGELPNMKKVGENAGIFMDGEKKPDWSDEFLMDISLRKVGKKMDEPFSELCSEWVDAYIEDAKNAPKCAVEVKREATRKYVEKLLSNGGPAVNQFKKMLGDEKANALLREFIFATEAR